MIAISIQSPGPREPVQRAYIPLTYDQDKDAWTEPESPRIPPQGFPDMLAAARACAGALRVRLADLDREARTLRALCEHPGLDGMDVDGVDAEILREHAKTLTWMADMLRLELDRLFEPPAPGEDIVIRGLLYEVSPEGGHIRLAEDQNPMAVMMHAATREVAIPCELIERTIDMLRQLLESADNGVVTAPVEDDEHTPTRPREQADKGANGSGTAQGEIDTPDAALESGPARKP